MLRNGFNDRVFLLLDELGKEAFLRVGTQLAEALLVSAQDGRHVEFLAVLVGHEHGYFVVAGLVTIVDDVGGIVSKLFFFTEITVVYNRVDVADGTVETDLVEVVVAACVVQVEQAAVPKGFGLDVVREALLRQVAEQRTFINIVVGVKVELLISAKSDIPLTPDCAYYNAHQLMKAGCTVWVFQPGFHHTKTLTVDGQLCTLGSANLNARSLRFDYEANLVIADSCTTKELDDLFIRETQRSFLLTPERWKQWRTPWQRFRGWLAHLLAPWL